MDEGIKYLMSLKDKKIAEVDLSENKFGSDTAQCFNKMLSNASMTPPVLIINDTKNGVVEKYVTLKSYGFKNIHVTVHNNKIGRKCAQFLNETFQSITVGKVSLDIKPLEAVDAEYLAQAFKDTKISKLNLSYIHIHFGIQYLVQAFKDSDIATLNVYTERLGKRGIKFLAKFLKKVKVLSLQLGLNCIGDDDMRYLVPALKNSDIMYIDLSWNHIKAEGARYLSEILKNSKILFLNLCNNHIGSDGARYLADGLRCSQVTGLQLDGNDIEYEGYQCLIDAVDDTNISWVNLHGNRIEDGLKEGNKLEPYCLPRSTTPISCKIRHIFKELVSLNPVSNELEFILPTKNINLNDYVDRYAFLIQTFKENPNSSVHIFDLMCFNEWRPFDLNAMEKIKDFIEIMPIKFSSFIDSKIMDLLEVFGDCNYTKLVEQFEEIKQYDIVEKLLLHRVLYYVDENQEILHPYIYKMLHKYKLPLYNEQLEPNKKDGIISYYQSHQEVDGAQEIIDFLRSESFQ